jgi:peptidoglycan/xylan/chitin deacetylase (PgdA/CDA1 family)
MKVHLTFDVEIWCGGWDRLDAQFPSSFERYVYGRSAQGEYALPATLDILRRHGLKAVFFVEPLFSARFGSEYLGRIVDMIESAGQEVQLHLHPEWTDEIEPSPIVDALRKRQHLHHYTQQEQRQLLQFGLQLLRAHAKGTVTAFRAGSYAANRDTYRALADVGLLVDSSLNRASADSGPGLHERTDPRSGLLIDGVSVYPVTVFKDGMGKDRPAQVGACGLLELRQALERAHEAGQPDFVIVSHNFEMLKPGRSEPDPIVVRRFERLCRYLAEHRDRYDTCGFAANGADEQPRPELRVGMVPTLMRLAAQAARRLI